MTSGRHPKTLTVMSLNIGARSVSLIPASFRQRVGAGLIDYVLTGIVVFSLGKLCSTSKSIATIGVVPLA